MERRTEKRLNRWPEQMQLLFLQLVHAKTMDSEPQTLVLSKGMQVTEIAQRKKA